MLRAVEVRDQSVVQASFQPATKYTGNCMKGGGWAGVENKVVIIDDINVYDTFQKVCLPSTIGEPT